MYSLKNLEMKKVKLFEFSKHRIARMKEKEKASLEYRILLKIRFADLSDLNQICNTYKLHINARIAQAILHRLKELTGNLE